MNECYGRSNLIDVDAIRVHQTERAILVRTETTDPESVWIPLSQCEFEVKTGWFGVLTLEENLAIEKGLI